MKQIAKAIQSVMKDVKGMEKNSRVGSGNSAYNGTTDKDVKEVFNEALASNGLCIMPIDIQEETQLDRWEEVDPWSKSTPKDKKSKQSVFTKVRVKYLLLHESGESVELMGYGHGVDPQDKGAGKATTYALKNCLLYTFLTPVGKIDDSETTHSNDIAQVPVVAKKQPAKKTLTIEDFNKCLESTNVKQIQTVLNKFELKDEQKTLLSELVIKLNEQKQKDADNLN